MSNKSKSPRLFNCGKCHVLVRICSDCDRGNRYCSKECSRPARNNSWRLSSQRYQLKFEGRRNHAKRQARYRSRQKIVTQQDSLPSLQLIVSPSNGCDTSISNISENGSYKCHFCHKPVISYDRYEFLGRIINRSDKFRNKTRDPTAVQR
jgi:hypothetical protein